LRFLKIIACTALVALLGLILGSAALSEGALHPARRGNPPSDAQRASTIAQHCHASVQSVNINVPGGVNLHAWWLQPAHPSGKIVIAFHGIGDFSISSLGFAPLFLDHGYSVLAPDSRGHGQSGGFATYGVLESHDVVEWTSWLGRTTAVSKVFGFGESLGGAIVLQSLRAGAPFRAVAAECAYSSFGEIARERIYRQTRLPVLRFLIVKTGTEYVKWRYNVDLSDANTLAAVAKAHTPILLIHGLDDDRTSPQNSRRMAEANPQWVQLWLVPGAGHTGAYRAAPAEFERRVLDWFNR
jgi:hypothetical protein